MTEKLKYTEFKRETWYASVYLDGKRVRRKAGSMEEAHRVALQLLAEHEAAKVAEREADLIEQGFTMADLITDTIAIKWHQTRNGEKAARNVESLCEDMDWLGKHPKEINQTAIDTALVFLRNVRRNSDATINRKFSALRVCLKRAVAKGLISHLPEIPLQAEAENRITTLTYEEEDALLQVIKLHGYDRLWHFVRFSVDTGLRVSEVLRLDEGDLSVDTEGNAQVLVRNRKGAQGRRKNTLVPLTSRAAESFLKWADLNQNMVNEQWDKVRAKLGQMANPEFVPHMLRHTCATRLIQSGMGLFQVKEWMGHAQIQTTMRYIHLDNSALLKGRELLERRG